MKPTFAVCAALIVNASPALAQTKTHTDSTATVKKGGIHIQTTKPTTKVSIKGKAAAGAFVAFTLEKVEGNPDQLKLVFNEHGGFTLDRKASFMVSFATTGSVDKTEPQLVNFKSWPAEGQPQNFVIHLKRVAGAAPGAHFSVTGNAGFTLCEKKRCGSVRYQPLSFP